MEECRLYGMKSHDCHVFMQTLIPLAFRDLLPKGIWDALTEINNFFRDLCSNKFVGKLSAGNISDKIIDGLCEFQRAVH